MERNISSAKFILIVVIACLAAFLVQHFVIYKQLIMPQLSSVKSMPLLWQGGQRLPIILITMFAGYWSKSIKEILIISFFTSAVYGLFVYTLSGLYEPGYLKSFEGPFLPSFIFGTFVHMIIFAILLSVGYGAKMLLVSRKQIQGNV